CSANDNLSAETFVQIGYFSRLLLQRITVVCNNLDIAQITISNTLYLFNALLHIMCNYPLLGSCSGNLRRKLGNMVYHPGDIFQLLFAETGFINTYFNLLPAV